MSEISMDEYKEKMANHRRVRQMAVAILSRAKQAGIPEHYMRINAEEVKTLLCPEYHKNYKEFADEIFNNPKILFNQSFIAIDGGTIDGRRRMGFALLFRMIACDRVGKYELFKTIAHNLSNSDFAFATSRNEYVTDLCDYDVLYLSEFGTSDINSKVDTGAKSFLDELFQKRDDNRKPTIISFEDSITSKNMTGGIAQESNIITNQFGQYLAMISNSDIKTTRNVLRIRVNK